jgi:hypothetical protein
MGFSIQVNWLITHGAKISAFERLQECPNIVV